MEEDSFDLAFFLVNRQQNYISLKVNIDSHSLGIIRVLFMIDAELLSFSLPKIPFP